MTSTTQTSSAVTATATCVTMTPDHNGYVPEYACNAQYNYYPSFTAAIIFSVIFGITTVGHIYQAFHHKKLRLCWPLIMGATWELAGFAIRTASTKNQQSVPLAFVSQLLVLLAPMWVNAFIYMVMGRMIYFFVPEKQLWRIKGMQIAKIFVWLDVISFITQVAGGTMIQPNSSSMMLGIHIYMGGIGFQEFCILIFTSIAIQFLLTMRRLERSSQIYDTPRNNWRFLLYVLLSCLALITIRIIFRLVEFSAGLDPKKNPIPFHEVYFYVLDASPMWLACVLLNIVHPGRILQGEDSEFPRLSRKQKKAAKLAKKEAKKAAKEEKRAMKEKTRHGSIYSEVPLDVV